MYCDKCLDTKNMCLDTCKDRHRVQIIEKIFQNDRTSHEDLCFLCLHPLADMSLSFDNEIRIVKIFSKRHETN